MLDRVDRTEPAAFVERSQLSKYAGLNPEFYRRSQRKNRIRAEQKAREEASRRSAAAREAGERRQREIRAEARLARLIGSLTAPLTGAPTDKIPVPRIIETIAAQDGYTKADILGPSRNKGVVACRHRAMAEARRLRPELSLTQLGKAFRRDHTTLLVALRKMGVPTASASQ